MKQQLSKEELAQLADKWLVGVITPEEQALLDNWYNTDDVQELNWLGTDDSEEQLRDRLFTQIKNGQFIQEQNYSRWWIAAAAMITLTVGVYISIKSVNQTSKNISYATDISPGGNKAFLTLADGKKISLNDAKKGILAEQDGIKIKKASDGELIYVSIASNVKKASENTFNTIETPKGGQWQVSLPDGTKVWLNAASSLKYPASFAAASVRRVELKGEAYFEVAKDKKHPFIVKTATQDIRVLGTHFNINSYADEQFTKTTLLEGSVSIATSISKKDTSVNPQVLKPGQQALNDGTTIRLSEVDTELSIAWKNNKFIFENDDIHYIMRMVERWYNVEVVYDGEIPKDKFGGAISRFGNVSEVLKSLQLTGKVHFEITGRRITVRK
ncbi:FecR family protein [Pedobacter mendelii]|uniref:Iron dicitrate transporter FecR n=1 Tax=Pedobacter mendelii TaxID=1908240 RepID=A0ABQ2BDM7_9SPHI|nr:FecR family protein [Pedobacter mendelii]GGI23736.1 iron dicitrate transporter FecR [Pedobacter mendelii]